MSVVDFAADRSGRAALLRHRDSGGWTAVVVSSDGEVVAERDLPHAEISAIRWRPGTRHVSVVADGEVLVWDPDGTVVPLTGGVCGRIRSHAWSPDGSALCVAADGAGPGTRLAVWAAGAVRWLAREPGASDTAPEWSPDGAVVAFLRRPSHAAADAARVWLADPSGAAPAVAAGHRPGWTERFDAGAWSPDGRRLACTAASAGAYEVGVWERRAGAVTWLRDVELSEGPPPVWSFRGNALLATGAAGIPTMVWMDTGDVSSLGSIPGGRAATWRWSPAARPMAVTGDGALWTYGRTGWRRLLEPDTPLLPAPELVPCRDGSGAEVTASLWRGEARGPGVVVAGDPTAAPADLEGPYLRALLGAGFSVIRLAGRAPVAGTEGARAEGSAALVAAARALIDLRQTVRVRAVGLGAGAASVLAAVHCAPDVFSAAAVLWPALEADLMRPGAHRGDVPAGTRRVPLLVLRGEHDGGMGPAALVRLREVWPDAAVEVIKGDGRGLRRSTGAACERLVSFLEGRRTT